MKTKLDNVDVDKITTVPADVSQLKNVMEIAVIKMTVYNKLMTKVNAINSKISSTIGLSTKTQYDSSKRDFEKKVDDIDKKIPNTSRLDKKTYYNTKLTEIENNIPSVTEIVATNYHIEYERD